MMRLFIAFTWLIVGLWAFQGPPRFKPEKVPPYYKSAEAGKPYPKTVPPERFAHPILQQVYRAAQKMPGVLVQQPCYCNCDRFGHGSLLHCHKDDHSAG